ncbi:MAG: zinc-ribbon domain-containing protein, partial [Polyangiaceae bacterium]
MHRVDCESCKATYQVDDRRIPPTGLKMRCPKCGHTFLVKMDGGAAVVKPIQSAASPEAPKPAAAAAPSAPKSSPPEADDPFGDLPAVTKAPATVAKPALPATQAERRPGGLGGLSGLGGARPALPATQQERRPGLALGGLGGGAAGAATKPALPATRAERSSPLAKPPQVAPVAPRPGLKSLDDLPAIVSSKAKALPAPSLSDPGLPTVRGASLDDLDADLPAAASPVKAALPKTVPGRLPPRAGQPAPAPPAIKPIASTTPSLELEMDFPAKAADLPAIGRPAFVTKPNIPRAAAVAPHARKEPPRAPDLELDMSFGEVGLPAVGYDAGLPALAGDLPELAVALPELASG